MTNTNRFFENIFHNAKVNGMLIMNQDGIVEEVNAAFTNAYGHTTEDLKGKHFRNLFTEKDRLIQKPESEIATTKREGSATDENYLMHKNGMPIWVSGESVLAKTETSACIVKIIHNIHAQKQLERYMLGASELLESLFHSVQQSGLLLLDSSLKIVKMNEQFKNIFGITGPVQEGTKLQHINHSFWHGEEVRNDIRNLLVSGTTLQKEYALDKNTDNSQHIRVVSKILIGDDGNDKRVLLVIKEA